MTDEHDTTPEDEIDLEKLRAQVFGTKPKPDPNPTSDIAAFARELFRPNPKRSKRIS